MKKCTLFLAGILCAFTLASPVGAQDLPTATKYKNVKWYTVRYTKFKPGKADEAREIIYNHFWKIKEPPPARKPAGAILPPSKFGHPSSVAH